MEKAKMYIIFNLLILKGLFEYIYIGIIQKAYPQVFHVDINIYKYLISTFSLLTLGYFYNKKYLYKNNKKASKVILIILFYLSYFPTSIYFGMNDFPYKLIFLYNLYWLCVYIFDKLIKLKFLSYKKIKLKRKIIKIVIYSIVLPFVIVTVIKIRGRLILGINLDTVYQVRELFNNSNLSTFYLYMLNWVGNIIIPISALYYYFKKKYRTFIFFMFLQIINFNISAQKGQLFIIPTAIVFSSFLKSDKIKKIPNGIIFLSIISIIQEILFKTNRICDYFIRRVFFTPSSLTYYYYDFFSKNIKMYLSEDLFISRIYFKLLNMQRNYLDPISVVISREYYKKESYANNGLFAYDYGNLGLIGVIMGPIVIIVILQIIDKYSLKKIEQNSGIIIITAIYLLSVSTSWYIYSFLIPYIIINKILKKEGE